MGRTVPVALALLAACGVGELSEPHQTPADAPPDVVTDSAVEDADARDGEESDDASDGPDDASVDEVADGGLDASEDAAGDSAADAVGDAGMDAGLDARGDSVVDAATEGGSDAGADGSADDGGTDASIDDPCPPLLRVTSGGQFSCAVGDNGGLYCWGLNDTYQLGLGDAITRPWPTRVGVASDWAAVTAGLHFACAVTTGGALYCWGDNRLGQLGLGDAEPRTVPTRVGGESDWSTVLAGYQHICGLRNSGALYCWGLNVDGEVGLGDGSPWYVRTPAEIAPGSRWLSEGLGASHSCGVQADSSLWCWGANDYGELGIGGGGGRNAPTRVGSASWRTASAGLAFSCGVQTDGSAWCWGFNNGFTLGLGDSNPRSSPAPLAGGPASWRTIASAETHNCGLAADGGLWCWGGSTSGILGLGDETWRALPTRIGGASDWTDVAPSRALHTYGGYGAIHTCAARASGDTMCWGGNRFGQLGVGDGVERWVPTQIPCDCWSGICGACGDGACEQVAGELCTMCSLDCANRDLGCGNGECQTGETPAGCPADCGPDPWPAEWATFAAEVVDLINAHRGAGTVCPSGALPPVGALIVDPDLKRAAELHAWDMSYSGYFRHASCNGRSLQDRAVALGTTATSEILGSGYTSPQAAVDGWVGSDAHCRILMDSGRTIVGAGYAKQTGFGYGTERWVVAFD